jgi:hypothetical protein
MRSTFRIRGGWGQDESGQYFALVTVWRNAQGIGVGESYRSAERFATEAEAMAHYVRVLRPKLMEAMQEIRNLPEAEFTIHKSLEDT